jgi:hypothetical protein
MNKRAKLQRTGTRDTDTTLSSGELMGCVLLFDNLFVCLLVAVAAGWFICLFVTCECRHKGTDAADTLTIALAPESVCSMSPPWC